MKTRKLLIVALSMLSIPTFGASPRSDVSPPKRVLVLIGTHTSSPQGGVFAAWLNQRTGGMSGVKLVAGVDRPTWLEKDPQREIVYAVSETGNDGVTQGGVLSLAVSPTTGKVSVLSRVRSGGGGATHLVYDARLATVFVANYGTGQVAAIPVDRSGTLAEPISVQTNVGSGPSPRQKSAHAHGVVVSPGGRYVLSADLGADRVFIYRWQGKELRPATTPWLAFDPGSGPRHLVFSRDGRHAFLTSELNGKVYSLRWDETAGTLTRVSDVTLDAPDFVGTRSAAELLLSRSGDFLYVSNRGENLLHVFAINKTTGALKEVQRIDCGGKTPWSMGFDPSGRWLLVTNEGSDRLNVFSVDLKTGLLTPTLESLSVPKPVAVTFVG